jgi:hypothetical protein
MTSSGVLRRDAIGRVHGISPSGHGVNAAYILQSRLQTRSHRFHGVRDAPRQKLGHIMTPFFRRELAPLYRG